MSEFNQTKYINTFIKEKYDTIKVQLPKGQKEIIAKKAAEKGFKSINAYIKASITKDINGDSNCKTDIHDNHIETININN